MNWFERYAIPGLYFVLLVTILYRILNGPLPGKEIIAVAFAGSLPIGYIFSIISQRIYYWQPKAWHIQRKAWFKASNKMLTEVEAETKVAVTIRSKISSCTEQGKWVQEWVSKRIAVIAINFTLMLITIVFWISCIVSFIVLTNLQPNWLYLYIFLGLTIFVFVGLICSTVLLNKSVIDTLGSYYKFLLENKET